MARRGKKIFQEDVDAKGLPGLPKISGRTAGGFPERYSDDRGDYYAVIFRGKGPGGDKLQVFITGSTSQDLFDSFSDQWMKAWKAVLRDAKRP